MKDDARELRNLLQDRCDELLARLFPGQRITAPTFTPRNPTRDDRTPGSFVIWTTGARRGGFRDYASNDSGDILDLCAYAHNKKGDRKFAFDFARDFLGLRAMTAEQRRAAREKAKVAADQARAADDARAAVKRRMAFKIFDKAVPQLAGTIAEYYLASREIPLFYAPNLETDLRFAPRLEWWKGAEWKAGRKVKSGAHFPAMVAAIRNHAGAMTAVHCTFLRADGTAKADVERPKLMLGDVRGSVIRIARGPSNLTPDEAALSGRRDPLIVTEGIEDALSIAIAIPEARVWAATSLGNLQNVPACHACIGSLIVAADNDWNKPDAQDALDRAVEQLRQHGVPVSVMRAHEGKDFNDLLRARDVVRSRP